VASKLPAVGKVFITRTVPGRAVELLEAAGHTAVTWPGELPPPRDALLSNLAEADAILSMVVDRLDNELLAACPRLRVAANMAVGYDNVDPAAAAALGIWLTNTPGVLAETTADLAFGLLLDAARNLSLSDRETRAGGWKTWSPTGYLGADVHGATLGIIGLGEIGTAMARRGRGFGMRILHTSRTAKSEAETELPARRVSLEELLAESDFVSIHTPLTPETRRFMGAPQFARMKSTAILVNTARGGVLDQDALVEALRSGQIAGAALDVTDPEPLPLEHPLFGFRNVVITPHIASASIATRARMAEMAAQNIIEVLAGRSPVNPVNQPTRR
jgi:glyoxylate reductase